MSAATYLRQREVVFSLSYTFEGGRAGGLGFFVPDSRQFAERSDLLLASR